MNRKQYLIATIGLAVIGVGLIVTNFIFTYMDWTWVFVIVLIGYIYLKYKLQGPLQVFFY